MRNIFLAAASIAAAATPALAEPIHRPHGTVRKRAVNRGHAPDPRDAEIKSLEATVDALTQRLDQQEGAQQATAQQVQMAQGLDYKPISLLDLALVYKRERANHGLLSTSNGTIRGPDYGTYDELGLFGQLTL